MRQPPPATPVEAAFFDGRSARRHRIEVRATEDGAALALRAEGAADEVLWPLPLLRQVRDDADRKAMVVTLNNDTGDESPRDPARLILTDPALVGWLQAHAPALNRRDVRRGTLGRIGLRLGAAAAAFALLVLVILPQMSLFLADRIPPETEMRLGQSVKSQIQWLLSSDDGETDLTCSSPAGDAALAQMKDRLLAGMDLPYPIDLVVFDHPMVNAFAAPGGHVVILRGLLDEAQSPDEVAGVLAHELGHVAARDPLRAAMRSAGTAGLFSLLVGDFSGGAVIALMGEHMLTAAYSREAEAAADAFAHRMLIEAGVDITGMAAFFDRISEDSEGLPGYLSTHPETMGRADLARSRATGQSGTTPVISSEEWAALRGICSDT